MRSGGPPPGADPDEPADPFASVGGWSDQGEPAPAPSGAPHPFDEAATHRYQLGGTIGIGGMGQVRLARDLRLGRDVAFKRLRPGADPELAARLAQEAQVTARLQHPGIVPIYDAGRGADGHLYYVMRLVAGRSLREAIVEADGLSGRLALVRRFLAACEAVAFAHQHGVIHRDLKPANVMLGAFGETQVVDWGLAWERGAAPPGLAGTPGYLAPELVEGATPSPASDVFALGVTLEELMTGAPPGMASREALAEAPVELQAIARRAQERRPEGRYPDAAALAADVTRYLDGRRVQAHAYSPRELLARFLVAWRIPLAVAAAAAVILAVGALLSFIQLRASRDRALLAEADAVGALARADATLSRLLGDRATEALALGHRAEAELLAARALELDPRAPAARGVLAAWSHAPRPRPGATAPLPPCVRRVLRDDGSQLLCLEADGVALWDLDPLQLRWRAPRTSTYAAFVPEEGVLVLGDEEHAMTRLALVDGAVLGGEASMLPRGLAASERAVVAWNGPEIEVLDVGTGVGSLRPACAGRGPAEGGAGVRAVAVGPAGQMAAVCHDGWVELGPLAGAPTGGFATPFGPPRPAAIDAALSPDGGTLALVGREEALALFDVRSGALRFELSRPVPLVSARFTPDGRVLVTLDEAGRVGFVAVDGGAWLGSLPPRVRRAVRVTPEGILAFDAVRRAWTLPEEPVPHVLATERGLSGAAPSPDGALVAMGRGDGLLLVRQRVLGTEVFAERWQDNVVKPGGWSPDGRRYAAGGVKEPSLRVWEAPDFALRASFEASVVGWRRAGFLRGGRLVGLSYDRSVGGVLFDVDRGERVAEHGDRLWFDLGLDPSADAAALLADDGTVGLLDGDGALTVLATVPGARAVDLRAGTAVLAEVGGLRFVGAEEGTLPMPERTVLDVAFSPDGQRLATAELEGMATLLRRDGATEALLPGHRGRVASVAFSGDGRLLVTAGWDGTARLWSTDAPPTREALEEAWATELGELLGSGVGEVGGAVSPER